jgi:hypothetical protein
LVEAGSEQDRYFIAGRVPQAVEMLGVVRSYWSIEDEDYLLKIVSGLF